MAPILHWFHLQKSLIFVVKRQCLSDVFFRERNVYFTRLTLYVLMEAGNSKTCRDKNFFSSRLEKYEGKRCFKRLVRASFVCVV